jgi:hypothetical protein
VPLDTPWLSVTFAFDYCSVPVGATCDQVDYSGGSGVVRLVEIVDGNAVSLTFDPPRFVYHGTYNTVDASSDTGILTVTGSLDAPSTVPEPSSRVLRIIV